MIYITGDTHGSFERVARFTKKMQTEQDDVMVILGDAGLNFDLGSRDRKTKSYVNRLSITTFCIHGNHEARPQTIPTYIEKEFHGGKVLFEPEYPNIVFAVDGEVYDFDGLKCLVIGGAYSIDKWYRLKFHSPWWPDEQPSFEVKKRVERKLRELDYKVDVVLSHTCPLHFQPREKFLPFFKQSSIDTSTEEWLEEIETKLDYRKWYFGHYHTAKRQDKYQIMFEDFDVLSTR